jgi:hypothetical protein
LVCQERQHGNPPRPSMSAIDLTGADGGTRTRTPLREADFKSAFSSLHDNGLLD